MGTSSIQDAEASLATLVERAAAGEEVVIARAGTPVARPVPVAPPPERREPRALGHLEGQVWIGGDFDDPLPDDMAEAFGAKP